MPNIAVGAAVGGATNNTDAAGKFTISFPNKNPGDTVRLIGIREGYTVVNDVQLEQTLPSDPEPSQPSFFCARKAIARRWRGASIA